MITLVLGGSGSGKSAYAEHLLDGKTNKYYIATMQVYDAEGEKKVARHRRLRAGKGFVTIEQPRDIGEVDFSSHGTTGSRRAKCYGTSSLCPAGMYVQSGCK